MIYSSVIFNSRNLLELYSTKITLEDGSKITQFEHKWGIDAIRLAQL